MGIVKGPIRRRRVAVGQPWLPVQIDTCLVRRRNYCLATVHALQTTDKQMSEMTDTILCQRNDRPKKIVQHFGVTPALQ